MSEQVVKILRADSVGILELARPGKFNCLSRRCFELMREGLDEFEQDTSVRVLLIRAQGKNFCTGADLEQVDTFGGSGDAAGDNSALGHEVLRRLESSRLPVIAAVQGLCLAGGMELMMACDLVIAGESARIGDQHARYGLIPGWGGSQRLPRLIGLRRALDLFFSAKWIDARTAESWGLVNQIVADTALQDAALKLCSELARRHGYGLELMKRLARQGLDMPLQAGLKMETDTIPSLMASPGMQEGLAAFIERREPDFKS
jgi:enoyl-CoA hydratase